MSIRVFVLSAPLNVCLCCFLSLSPSLTLPLPLHFTLSSRQKVFPSAKSIGLLPSSLRRVCSALRRRHSIFSVSPAPPPHRHPLLSTTCRLSLRRTTQKIKAAHSGWTATALAMSRWVSRVRLCSWVRRPHSSPLIPPSPFSFIGCCHPRTRSDSVRGTDARDG